MADVEMTQGNEGSEFSAAFAQFRDDTQGQSVDRSDIAEIAEEPHGEPDGQGQEPPHDAAAEPASGDDAPDVWQNVSPAILKARKDLMDRLEKAEQAKRSSDGRASQAQRELNALRELAARQPQAVAPAPPATARKGVIEDEALVRIRDEYPEVAAPLIAAMASLEEQIASLKGTDANRQQREALQAELQQREYLASQEQALSDRHADWRDIVKAPEFAAWRDSQLPYIRAAIANSTDAAETADILSRFKAETGMAAPVANNELAARRERQLNASRGIAPRNPPIAATASPAEDYSNAFRQFAAKAKPR